MTMLWTRDSWRDRQILQQPHYEDAGALAQVRGELEQLPPLVMPSEVHSLSKQLAQAARGERFILQGGDCAELFADCSAEKITTKLQLLLQVSLILVKSLRMPVSRIGRIAGQYAKPRSAAEETQQGVTLPTFRGELINSRDFSAHARSPKPQRMLQGYSLASLTLNYIRALCEDGFADLRLESTWDMRFLDDSASSRRYQAKANEIRDSLQLVDNLSAAPETSGRSSREFEFFTSHEALLLEYESALTRKVDGRWYNLSTHFPWVGMRTAIPGSSHIEYLRGIANPIAMKLGPRMSAEWLIHLLDTLDPDHEEGRITLIHRFGVNEIESALPPLLEAVNQSQHCPLWLCDPMHGNTRNVAGGLKTRRFDDILTELQRAVYLHRAHYSILGGVHLEMTADNVTECTGGMVGVSEDDLQKRYHSAVDPRLNMAQVVELAFALCDAWRADSERHSQSSMATPKAG